MAADLDSLKQEFKACVDRGDHAGALERLLDLCRLDGETEDRLLWKHELLSELGRHEEALEAAIRYDQVSTRQSPFGYIRVAETHMALGRTEEAIAWIERAIRERGFRHARLFQHEPFDALETHPRYAELVDEAAQNTGVGTVMRDFELLLLDGRRLRLSDLRGSVVLIDFWATICPPCVEEMPTLQRLYKELAGTGFTILGISLDSDVDAARTFLVEHEIAWPSACSGDRWADRTAKLLNVHATPSMWLLDRRGVIRAFDLRGDDLGKAVRELLAED
jgi:peroxiredoxin